jgi:hypothetical protein
VQQVNLKDKDKIDKSRNFLLLFLSNKNNFS